MTVTHTEWSIVAHDGVPLFLQRWQAEDFARAELFVVPGYADHGARYDEMARRLAEHRITTVTMDPRGHGHSGGRRGHVSSFDQYLNDLDLALREVDRPRPFLLGHSNGGLIALDYVSRRSPDLCGLIVTNPFVGVAMKISLPKLWAGRLAGKTLPTLAVPSGLMPSDMSHDQEMVKAYAEDPLIFKKATAGWFHEAVLAQRRVNAIGSIELPLLYIYSDTDPVAAPDVNARLAAQIRGDDKTIWVRHGEKHEVLNESSRERLHHDMAEWIVKRAKTTGA